MTRSKIAKILGINKYEVKRIELQAITKLQLAVGVAVDSRLLHRRRKRCGECGEYGHQKQTCKV
jgi:hypothetical protein